MRLTFLLVLASWVICVFVPSDCAEWYVDDSVSESGDGTSWQTAFKTIQEGIGAAGHGDTVTVAPGVYTGTGNKELRYNGKRITLESRDGAATTIIDCERAGQGVVFDSEETSQSILRGFTIENGDGGIRVNGSGSPTITKCVITRHFGTGVLPGDAAIIDCVVSRSERGIICSGGSPTITNTTVSDNLFDGIRCFHSAAIIVGCRINRNRRGVNISRVSEDRIVNCTITGNTNDEPGGGIASYDTTPHPIIERCILTGNSAPQGGGIFLNNSSAPIFNCVIAGNQAGQGGGIYMENCTAPVTNCTIAGNMDGGGLHCGNPTVVNTILGGNSPQQVFGTPAIKYCNVQGGWFGPGNISDDPFPYFMSPVDVNYRLHPDSPCVDAGTQNPDVVQLPDTDILGIHRMMYGGKAFKVDMGAYEFHIWPPALDSETGNLTLKWSTLAEKTYSIYYSGDMLTWELLEGGVASMLDTVTMWIDPSPSFSTGELRRRYYKVLENE